jgi:CubicO group peptidase (beta-lactamase class C family)
MGVRRRSSIGGLGIGLFAAVALVGVVSPATTFAQGSYFPPAGAGWERRTPEQVGMNAARVAEAVAMAIAGEVTTPRDLLENHRLSFGREPMGEAIGPFKDRGAATGVIVRNGYIVAEWGDPERVDLTFSVTKSFLSTTVGLAYDRGMIRDLNQPVREYFTPVVALNGPLAGAPGAVPGAAAASEAPPTAPAGAQTSTSARAPGAGAAFDLFEVMLPFESEHNRKITWDHLLRQTSDWEGTLWGKPDWVDRAPQGDLEAWRNRPRNEPGTSYRYNDVRVNLLALAALNVWRRPLPEVLKEYVMDPIGASSSWRWYGYDNSWVVLDGRLVQSVSGGAHWGGGMWINARDMARFGLLTLHRGQWDGRQLVSDQWVSMALTPTPVQTGYGFMNWYLRPDGTFYHSGAGPNVIYVDPRHDLVVVSRWVNNWNAVVQRVVSAIEQGP